MRSSLNMPMMSPYQTQRAGNLINDFEDIPFQNSGEEQKYRNSVVGYSQTQSVNCGTQALQEKKTVSTDVNALNQQVSTGMNTQRVMTDEK